MIHAAVTSKQTGMTMAIGRGCQTLRKYNGGEFFAVKLFDKAPAEQKCSKCSSELAKMRARLARK